ARRHGTVLDHRAVIAIGHRRHLAVVVARMLIAGEDAELLDARFRFSDPHRHVGVARGDAAQRASRHEVGCDDPHRHAGIAAGASGAIGEMMRAAETAAREFIVVAGTDKPDEFRHQLAFDAARDVRAGHRCGAVEMERRRRRNLTRDRAGLFTPDAAILTRYRTVHREPSWIGPDYRSLFAAVAELFDAIVKIGKVAVEPVA